MAHHRLGSGARESPRRAGSNSGTKRFRLLASVPGETGSPWSASATPRPGTSGRRHAQCSNKNACPEAGSEERSWGTASARRRRNVTSRGDDAHSQPRRQRGRSILRMWALTSISMTARGALAVGDIGLAATGTDARILRRVVPFLLRPRARAASSSTGRGVRPWPGAPRCWPRLRPRARRVFCRSLLLPKSRLRQHGPARSAAWQSRLPVSRSEPAAPLSSLPSRSFALRSNSMVLSRWRRPPHRPPAAAGRSASLGLQLLLLDVGLRSGPLRR